MEIHAPEHPIHTWRDFFIHIATIVVGLLIAIGLEQTVEAMHHHRQVAETREALRVETEKNRQSFAVDARRFREASARLNNNMMVLLYLKQHPQGGGALPGILAWGNNWQAADASAWKTAQTTGITALMPQDEVARNAELYDRLKAIDDANEEVWRLTTRALSYRFVDADLQHMSPADIDDAIKTCKELMSAHFRRGVEMENLNETFRDFAPAPSNAELHDFVTRLPGGDPGRDVAAAEALTEKRIAAAAQTQ